MSPEALAELREDGLEFLGRGFRELGEPHADGDLLNLLQAAAERDETGPAAWLLAGAYESGRVLDAVKASTSVVQCDCPDGEGWHDLGSDGCVGGPDVEEPDRPIEDVHLPPFEPSGLDEFASDRVVGPVVSADPDGIPQSEDVASVTPDDEEEPEELNARTLYADENEIPREPLAGQSYWCRDCAATIPGRHLEGCAFGPLPQGPMIVPWRTWQGPDGPLLITLPGVYDLAAEQYHDVGVTGDWFSNSDAKHLLATCPAQFDYDRRNRVRKTSDAFDFGHVWHAVILGKGEAYQVFEPKKLDGRTKDGKAQRADVEAARAAGITPIYGDQFALIKAMAEAVKADPIPYQLLTAPGRQEVCLFWREQIKVTDPHNQLYGQTVTVQRRAMIDHLPDMPGEGETVTLVDGKTADEVKPDDNLRRRIYDYGYHRQADTYAAAVEALFDRAADVVFLMQSKKPPHLIVPVELDTPAMLVAQAENRQALEQWAECVATGVWPGYVTNGVAMSGVPAWIERQYEEEMVII